jgi:hypothetical protein
MHIFGRYLKRALLSVIINKIRHVWKRAKKQTGRMSIGAAPNEYRSWQLTDPRDNLIAMVTHTHDKPSYVNTTEPPAWVVRIRVPAHLEERDLHGALRDVVFKARFPSPLGEEDGVKPAMDFAVKQYLKWMEGREHLK